MKKAFTVLIVIILVASSVYVGYGVVKKDQSAEDSGAYAIALNNVCAGDEVPTLMERVVLNAANDSKTYTLEAGKYFVKIGGEGYEKAAAEDFNHFITAKVNGNNKKYKIGVYLTFEDAGGGVGAGQYWHWNEPKSNFVVQEGWNNKTVIISIGNESDGSFGPNDTSTYTDFEYYIGTCTNGTASSDLADYVLCENGSPSLVLEKTVDLVPDNDRWYDMTLEPGEYVLILKKGDVYWNKKDNDGTIYWDGSVFAVPSSLKDGAYNDLNSYIYVGTGSIYTPQSLALSKFKGLSGYFKIDTTALVTFIISKPIGFEMPITNTASGSSTFVVYKCDGGVVYTPPTCTSFTYGEWGTCTNGVRERAVATSTPANCTGGNPVLTETCTVAGTPTCTNFTYSDWSTCAEGIRTRTVLSATPTDCTGGNAIIEEACVDNTEGLSSGECADADVNADGEIGLVDLSNFLSKYNTVCTKSASKTYGPCGSQDSNDDGKIGLVDLASLLGKYGKSCEL